MSDPALGWMEGRAEPPKVREGARLPGERPVLWRFWMDCKSKRRCGRAPYDRLLSNPMLRADYRVQGAARGRSTRKTPGEGSGRTDPAVRSGVSVPGSSIFLMILLRDDSQRSLRTASSNTAQKTLSFCMRGGYMIFFSDFPRQKFLTRISRPKCLSNSCQMGGLTAV